MVRGKRHRARRLMVRLRRIGGRRGPRSTRPTRGAWTASLRCGWGMEIPCRFRPTVTGRWASRVISKVPLLGSSCCRRESASPGRSPPQRPVGEEGGLVSGRQADPPECRRRGPGRASLRARQRPDSKTARHEPTGLSRVSSAAVSPDGQLAAVRGPDQRRYLYPLAGGEPMAIPGILPREDPIGWIGDGKRWLRSPSIEDTYPARSTVWR